jgi:predicted nucleic acid-binding protein
MRVVDTSLWIEVFTRGPLLEEAKQAALPLNECIVPAMVHYELAKWSSRVLPHVQAQDVVSLLTKCVLVDMDKTVAIEAARLSLLHKLHATDAIIYATARLSDTKLYTCDAHFKDLPEVEYWPKPA